MDDVSQETVAPPNRKISVTFERKKDLGNYENVTARAWIEGVIPEAATTQDEAQAVGFLFLAAATAVLDQLDIPYDIDTEAGVVREQNVPSVSVEQTAAMINRQMPGGVVVPSGDGSIRVMNHAECAENGPLPQWLQAECNKLGITGVWDRRHTATGNQPLFQEAVARGADGHGKDGKPKGFWPPK